MTDLVRKATLGKMNSRSLPDFRQGDTISVHVKVKEGGKERVQVYKGIVIKIQGSGAGKSFTVRKISGGVGVERTFPFMSPSIDHVEVQSKGKVRRSRLFFLRALKGRAARIDSELVVKEGKNSQAGANTVSQADLTSADSQES